MIDPRFNNKPGTSNPAHGVFTPTYVSPGLGVVSFSLAALCRSEEEDVD